MGENKMNYVSGSEVSEAEIIASSGDGGSAAHAWLHRSGIAVDASCAICFTIAYNTVRVFVSCGALSRDG